MSYRKTSYETKMNPLQKGLEVVSTAILLGMLIFVLVKFPQLPDQIPKQYDLLGEISAWGRPRSILFVPIFCVVVYGVILFMMIFPSIWRMPKAVNREHQLYMQNVFIYMLCLVKLETFGLAAYLTYCKAMLMNANTYVSLLVDLTLIATLVIGVYRLLKIPPQFKGYYR